MADSRRQTIAAAIKTRIARLTTGNGYETNIGSKCFLWKTGAWEADELPGVDIRDMKDDIEGKSAGLRKELHKLRVEAEVACKSGTTTAYQVRKMIADIYTAIGVDRTWGGIARTTDAVGDEMGVEQQNRTLGGAKVTFIVEYTTAYFDPYTA